jgi:hypothetical protein
VPSAVSTLYDPLIERDIDAIPAAVRTFADGHGMDELWSAVARFAVLAYSPSEHGKHSVMSCLAARELLASAGERAIDLIAECATYAASCRQPWSEPPISDPPALAGNQRRDLAEIRAAIDAGDRLRAERWLASRIDDPQLGRDFFTLAGDSFGDLGHQLLMAVTTWKLATVFDPRGRFATLRVAVWEWTSSRGPRFQTSQRDIDSGRLADALVDRFIEERGSLISGHALLLFDAASEAAGLAGDASIEERVCSYLRAELDTGRLDRREAARAQKVAGESRGVPVYRLARDYGECLQMYAVAMRLGNRFPSLPVNQMLAAAWENLETAPSFEEWSFA